MSIVGAGAGAAKALEEILGEQMLRAQMAQREKQAAAQMEMERARLSESARQADVDAKQRQQTIDLSERTRRDRNNDRGLDLMKADKADMDLNEVMGSLPAHLKPISGLMKIGALGKLSPDDLQSPEERETAAKNEEAREIRIRNASRAPQAPREKKQAWVIRGGQPVPIDEGTAQPGDMPYDAVAARSSQPKDQAEAQDTAREAKRLASELLAHKGFNRAFGTIDAVIPPLLSQDKADASGIRDALTSMLTLENMSKMKGVLSDSDMKVLKQASTTLNAQMSEGAARAELNRIIEVMGRVGGVPAAAPDATDTNLSEVRYERDPKTGRLVRVGG